MKGKRKLGLKRRLAVYFAVVFLIPAIIVFYLFYTAVSSQFLKKLEDQGLALSRLIKDRLKSIELRLQDSLGEISSMGDFTALLMQLREGNVDYGEWANFGKELALSVGVDEIRIYDNNGRFITSNVYKEKYGLKDPGSNILKDGKPFLSVILEDGHKRLMSALTEIHTLPDGMETKICAGIFVNKEFLSIGNIFDDIFIFFHLGDVVFKGYKGEIQDNVGYLEQEVSQNDDSLSVFIKNDYLELEIFRSETIENIPIKLTAYSSLDQLNRFKDRLYLLAIVLILLGLIFSVSFGLLISRPFVKGMEDLLRSMRLASLGETEGVSLSLKRGGQLESISGSFNRLIEEISEQQQKLLDAERIKAWQDIARKMAHEIKNPLSPIKISAETMKKAYAKKANNFDDILDVSASVISEEVERIRQTVNEFVDFARLPEPNLREGDLNRVIRSVVSLYESDSKVRFEIDLNILPELRFDADQMSRVLHNLIKNSLESIYRRDEGFVRIESYSDVTYTGDVAVISVEDNGSGMDEITLKKIFTPYFTTKEGGSGLGMTICYRIIHEHGGSMDIDSEKGRGTRVILKLPGIKED